MLKAIDWSELFIPEKLQSLLQDIRYWVDIQIEIKADERLTIIHGNNHKHTGVDHKMRMGDQFTLIPDTLEVDQNGTATLTKTKTFNLSNFPQILNFVKNHCQYIHDFITEEKIEDITIQTYEKITYLDGIYVCGIKLTDFKNLKRYLESENDEIQPFVFSALVRSFYHYNNFKKPFIINPTLTETLAQIRKNIRYVNSLFDTNVNILKQYTLEPIYDNSFNGDSFNFFKNEIIRMYNINLYKHNMDIKFISYINQSNLDSLANINIARENSNEKYNSDIL